MSFAIEMLEMLTSAYDRSDITRLERQEKPQTNIGKLFSLLGYGFDVIQENAERVRLWDNLDQAQGKSLDRYGANYGVYRGEASDEIYRVMIKVKILSMLSAGNLDTIINAAAILFDVKNSRIEIEEIFPAKIFLFIEEEDLDEIHITLSPTIALLMRRIKAAGIGMRIFRRTYYHAREMIYTGTLSEKFAKKKLGPSAKDRKIMYQVPLNMGTGTIIYVKKNYMPKVFVLSETGEQTIVTTQSGATVTIG